jgi:hypothetical protein
MDASRFARGVGAIRPLELEAYGKRIHDEGV